MEIHNEEIVDLLDDKNLKKQVTIRETPDGEIMVQGATEEDAKSAEEMMGCLERGSLNRATGSTLMNAQSSRSHAIFTVLLDQTRMTTVNGEPSMILTFK